MSTLLAALERLHRHIERVWPEDCCKKAWMQESNGRRTLCCLDSCAWNHLYLSIVQVEMDVEFPVLGESRAEKRRMEDVMSPLQEALASASPQGACALREALSAYVWSQITALGEKAQQGSREKAEAYRRARDKSRDN